MAVTTEVKISVSRTINLGNYESIKIEGSISIGKDSDNDTPKDMRNRALEEINDLINEAIEENVPQRRRGEVQVERKG